MLGDVSGCRMLLNKKCPNLKLDAKNDGSSVNKNVGTSYEREVIRSNLSMHLWILADPHTYKLNSGHNEEKRSRLGQFVSQMLR